MKKIIIAFITIMIFPFFLINTNAQCLDENLDLDEIEGFTKRSIIFYLDYIDKLGNEYKTYHDKELGFVIFKNGNFFSAPTKKDIYCDIAITLDDDCSGEIMAEIKNNYMYDGETKSMYWYLKNNIAVGIRKSKNEKGLRTFIFKYEKKIANKASTNQNSAKTSNNIRTNDNIQKSKSNTRGVSVKNKPIKTEENQNSSYLENKQKESLNIKRIKDTIEARTKTYGPFPNKFSGTLHAFDTWINCELTLNIDSIGNLIINGSTNQNERFNFKWNLTQSKNSTNVFTGSVLHEYYKISQKVRETYPIRMDLSKINCCFIQGSCVMSKKDYLNQNGIYGDLVFRTYSNKNSLIKCFNEEIAILQTELKQSTLSRKERKKIESYIESKKEAIRNLDKE